MDNKQLLEVIYDGYFFGHIVKGAVGTKILFQNENEIIRRAIIFGLVFYEREFVNGCITIYSCGDDGDNILPALEYHFGKVEFDTRDEEYKYYSEVLKDNMITHYRC